MISPQAARPPLATTTPSQLSLSVPRGGGLHAIVRQGLERITERRFIKAMDYCSCASLDLMIKFLDSGYFVLENQHVSCFPYRVEGNSESDVPLLLSTTKILLKPRNHVKVKKFLCCLSYSRALHRFWMKGQSLKACN